LDAIDTSKTHRLYVLLKERIVSGALAAGQRLPSEPALAATHGMSRVTIRRALDGLERDGLIVRQPGSGTFVREAPGPTAITGDFSNMLQSLIAMGRATRVKLIAFNYVTPPPAIAEALGLSGQERAQHSLRVRYLDDEPFSHLSTHVPERIGVSYSEADLATTPLLSLLERSGVVAASAEQTLTATLAGPETAEALGVEIGAPLISLIRVVRDAQGRGIEHLSALYRPDKHQFRMALTRVGEGAERHWRPSAHTVSTHTMTPTTGRRGASPARRRA
jgi:GntR family transcriptional regulator